MAPEVNPVAAAERRLEDARLYWHRAHESYSDPEEFRMMLNGCIQTLRTVTFLLQKQKKRIRGFDAWYGNVRERLAGDAVMAWLVDARNTIEKVGDLEQTSTARLQVIDSYLDEPAVEIIVPPFADAETIGSMAREILAAHGVPNASVVVERRWVAETLPELEILEAAAHGYRVLAGIIAEANCLSGTPEKAPASPERSEERDPMEVAREDRMATVAVESGELLRFARHPVDVSEGDGELIRTRYGLTNDSIGDIGSSDLGRAAEAYFAIARSLFERDGYHRSIAMLYKDDEPRGVIPFDVRDQAEKYLMFRQLANEVARVRANRILIIGEVWTAVFDAAEPLRHAKDAPEREEELTLLAAAADGSALQLSARITRGKSRRRGIRLGQTKAVRVPQTGFLVPFSVVWKRGHDSKASKSRNEVSRG
jgi:hypothetical protein